MTTEFPEQSLSGLCVHRVSVVKSYWVGVEARSKHNAFQTAKHGG